MIMYACYLFDKPLPTPKDRHFKSLRRCQMGLHQPVSAHFLGFPSCSEPSWCQAWEKNTKTTTWHELYNTTFNDVKESLLQLPSVKRLEAPLMHKHSMNSQGWGTTKWPSHSINEKRMESKLRASFTSWIPNLWFKSSQFYQSMYIYIMKKIWKQQPRWFGTRTFG